MIPTYVYHNYFINVHTIEGLCIFFSSQNGLLLFSAMLKQLKPRSNATSSLKPAPWIIFQFSINLSLFLVSAAHIVYAGISQGVLGNVEDIKWHADKIISSSEARLSH